MKVPDGKMVLFKVRLLTGKYAAVHLHHYGSSGDLPIWQLKSFFQKIAVFIHDPDYSYLLIRQQNILKPAKPILS
jgi:hypothetical protein